jgi:tetratricopeptide (TPR) repeat protein
MMSLHRNLVSAWVLIVVLVFQNSLAQSQIADDAKSKHSRMTVSAKANMDPQSRLEKAKERFVTGQKAYERGLLQQALSDFQEANRLVPSAELAYNIGQVYERLGNAGQAISFFTLYLSRSGANVADGAKMSTRIARLRQWERRQHNQILEAPALVVEQALEDFKRGIAMFEKGKYKNSLSAFAAAERLQQVPELSYNMALTSERLGRWSDAIVYYSAYLQAEKDLPDRKQIEGKIAALGKAMPHEQKSGHPENTQ